MLASLSPGADAPLDDPQLLYEPKYDGIRAIAEVTPPADRPVRLWSRLGNEKTRQFPDVAAALTDWSRRLRAPVVLDGEIVALERIFPPRTRDRGAGPRVLRLSEIARADGRALYQHALTSGWEGLVAKRVQSRYASGRRTPDWRKIKIVHQQKFVVGGWTKPQGTRSHFGALLLGVYAASHQPLVMPCCMPVMWARASTRASSRA